MSTCPIPDAATRTNYSDPSAVVVAPPTPVDESCNDPGGLTTIGAPGVTSVATQYIPVAGPMGPKGDCGKGFEWESAWEEGVPYVTWQDGVVCNASTVKHAGGTYICILDHMSDSTNEPGGWFNDWPLYWEHIAEDGRPGPLGIAGKLKDTLDNFFDFVTDIPNWGVGDWIKGIGAAAAVVGAIVVGKKVIDMMDDAGEVDADGNSADVRYTGSPGLASDPVYPSLPDVIARICRRGGLADSQFDVSALPTSQKVYGATLIGSATDALNALKYVYGFEIVKTTSKLIFVPYDMPAVITIPMEDMGFENSKSSLSRYSASRLQTSDLPRRVSLTFKSAAMNYHEDQEKAELFSFTNGQLVEQTLPLVLTNQQAKDIAERALVLSHSEANTVYFTLPYKYMDLQPGDNVVTDLGTFRIVNIDENPNNVLNVEAVSANEVEVAMMSSGQAPRTPAPSTNTQVKVGFTFGALLDLPPLNASDNKPRLHAIVHGYNNPQWPGCQIFETKDGQTYDVVATSDRAQTTVGIVSTAVASVPEHKAAIWDTTTEIIVTLKTNQLISAPSDLAVYNGANLCMIGAEMIAFRYADLIGQDAKGNKQYKLTRLMRGMRGTEWAISEHQADELFVLVDDALIELPFNQDEWGRERTYRFVTNGSDPSIVGDQKITPYMVNLIPWRVAHLSGEKIASSNDYGFSWTPRASFNNELQNFKQVTKNEDWAGWTIAIIDPNDDTVIKRTEHVTAPNFTYTEAMQLEDFGTLQSQVKLKCVTMSRNIGGGYSRVVTVS